MTPLVRPVRVLLAGGGGYPDQNHAESMYLPALRRRDDVRIIGLRAFTPEDEEFAAREGLPVIAPDARGAEADAAIVCAPIGQRRERIIDLLEDGVRVLCDKPAAASAPDIEAIMETERATGVPVTVAHHFRFHTMLGPTAASIAGGAIGLPFLVQADLLVAGGRSQGEDDLVNLGVHVTDLVRFLLTGSEVESVRATRTRHGAVIHLDHAHGVHSTIVLARTDELAGVVPASSVVHRYRVSGSHGTETIDLTKPGIRSLTRRGAYQRWIDGSSVDRLLDDWLRAVRAGAPGGTPLADALAVARILDTAAESARTGEAVACVPAAPLATPAPHEAPPSRHDATRPTDPGDRR